MSSHCLRRFLRPVRFVVAATIVATVATGCMSGELKLKVNSDGGGEFTVEVSPTSETKKLLDDSGAVDAGRAFAAARDGARFEEVIEDGTVTYKSTVPFEKYNQIGNLLSTGVVLNEKPVRIFKSFSLKKSGDNWELRAELVEDLGPTPAGEAPGGSELRFSVALPGQVRDSNADETNGGTATWVLRSSDTELNMVMVTEPKPLLTGTQKLLVGLGVVALVVIVAAVLVLKRLRRRKANGPGGSQVQGGPASAPGPVSSGGRDATGLPTMSVPVGGAPQQPTYEELPPVAPPTPPAIDVNQPNPFAPHRPGAPRPGEVVQAAKPATFDYVEISGDSDPPQESASLAAPVGADQPAPADPAAPEEMPVGSVAPADSTDEVPPDWYPDPDDPTRYRWWDGQVWTEHTS